MRSMSSAEYGHMHLSIFYRQLLLVNDRGLMFKNKHYPWGELQDIEVWQEPWPGWGYVPAAKLLPRASVTFSNGQNFMLRGDALVKRGQPLSEGFSNAFDELVSYLREKRGQQLKNAYRPNA
jgi:hypothetical protein